MTFETDRQRTLLFGGALENGEYCNETWEFDGKNWKRLDVPSPPIYPGYCLAYDVHRGVAVLYGGAGRETWEFDGKAWKRVSTPHRPPIRGYGAMAYDPNRQVIVLFGGEVAPRKPTELPGLSNETWEYDGFDWVRVRTDGPPPRKNHRMVYDSARRRFVVFGGFNTKLLNDTWELRASGWRKVETTRSPRPRRSFAMTYDPSARLTLLFGGYPGGDELWAFDGAEWQQIMARNSPPFREGAGLVYLPTTKRLLLFGGLSLKPLNDTWELAGTVRRPMAQALPPPPPAPAGLAPVAPPRPTKRPTVAEKPKVPPVLPRQAKATTVTNIAEGKTTGPAELHFENVRLVTRHITPGRSFALEGKLVNSGGADADFWVEFWLSPRRKPFERSRMLSRSLHLEVTAGGSCDLSGLYLVAEEGLAPGKFYLGIEADRIGEVPEKDKSNNLFVIEEPCTIVGPVEKNLP